MTQGPAVHERRRTGFSLVELLMAMTIVSLLAAIAVPRWHRVRERSVIAAMRADVRNLAVLEESYFYDFTVYTSDLGSLSSRGFVGTVGVQLQIHEATNIGWSVSTSHSASVQQCHLYVGSAAPVGTATQDGRVDCQ
jgi:prepilin-type N-terminal cleavage/methylation domain-containing protein